VHIPAFEVLQLNSGREGNHPMNPSSMGTVSYTTIIEVASYV
jgi:hypothetical protein